MTDSGSAGPGDAGQCAPSKLLGLEVIRFLSACAVLIWHYQHFYYIADKPGPAYVVPDQPLYGLLAPLYQAGYYGVNVFWCISGFIFFWKYRHTIAERRIGPGKFFLLRFSRLYPLHIATLLLVLLLQQVYFAAKGHYFVYPFNDLYHFVLQLFFASNWGLQEGYSFNGPIWSISIEVLIYLLFFLTLRYIGTTIWVGVAALAIAGAAKVLKLESPVFDCLGFFYIGGLTCVARQYRQRMPFERLLQKAAWALVVIVPVAAVAVGAFQIRHFNYLFWLTYTPLLLYVGAADFNVGARAQTLIEAAGNMTYSSYLIHFPLQVAIAGVFAYAGCAIPLASPGFLIAFVLVTLVLSYFIFELFEKPAQKIIRSQFGNGRGGARGPLGEASMREDNT